MEYEVTARCIKGTKLIGVKAKEINNGNVERIVKIKTEEFKKLAKGNKVKNFKVVTLDGGNEYITGSKMSELEIEGIKGTFDISGRVTDENGKVIGYEIVNEDTQIKSKVSIEDAWRMGYNKSLRGIRPLCRKVGTRVEKIIIVQSMIDL